MKRVLIFFFSISSFFSVAQLDSIQVELTHQQISNPEDSLDLLDILNVIVSIYDIDFMGDLVITVYHDETSFPVQRIKYTKQQLIDSGIISDQTFQNTVVIPFYELERETAYKVDVLVRNYQGAFLPVKTVNYEFL